MCKILILVTPREIMIMLFRCQAEGVKEVRVMDDADWHSFYFSLLPLLKTGFRPVVMPLHDCGTNKDREWLRELTEPCRASSLSTASLRSIVDVTPVK